MPAATHKKAYEGWTPRVREKPRRKLPPPLEPEEYEDFTEACRGLLRCRVEPHETIWDPGLRAWCGLPPLED